jgi:hypothetical protein
LKTRPCEIFDFGTGGTENDYKSHLGNIWLNCAPLEIGCLNRPYSLLPIALQEMLPFAKNTANIMLGSSPHVKKAIRSSGAS